MSLTSCATTSVTDPWSALFGHRAEPVVVSDFCAIYPPKIRPSRNDTTDTLRQINVKNRQYDRLCPEEKNDGG